MYTHTQLCQNTHYNSILVRRSTHITHILQRYITLGDR